MQMITMKLASDTVQKTIVKYWANVSHFTTLLQHMLSMLICLIEKKLSLQTRDAHPNVSSKLTNCLRRWPSIELAFGEHFVFPG